VIVAGAAVNKSSGIVNGLIFPLKIKEATAPGVSVPAVLTKGVAAVVVNDTPFMSNSPFANVSEPLRVRFCAFQVSLLSLFIVTEVSVGDAGKKVFAGIENAAPAVLPAIPNTSDVPPTVVIVPDVFIIGKSPFWKVSVLAPIANVPPFILRVNAPFIVRP